MAKSRRQKFKPVRSTRVVRKGSPAVIGISCDGEEGLYLVTSVVCDIGGRGWNVWRLTAAKPYSVRIGPGQEESCDCIGYNATDKCRHLLAIKALVGKSLL